MTRTDGSRGRLSPPTVATATVALSLLYVGIIRILEPDLNTKAVAFGVYLIAVTAALCLNAFALGAMSPPADVRVADRQWGHDKTSAGDPVFPDRAIRGSNDE